MNGKKDCINLLQYKAWILDFDGTLYYQFPVRIWMGVWLMVYYLFHPSKIKELLIVLEYRKLRESMYGVEDSYFYERQLKKISLKYHIDTVNVEKVLKTWTENKPQFVIRLCQRVFLIKTIKHYQKQGIIMVVYSDNPVCEKAKALSFVPDYLFDSRHTIIQCMKPNPCGLNNIVQYLGLNKTEVLFIGDRYDRDGLCAYQAKLKYYDIHDFIEILKKH